MTPIVVNDTTGKPLYKIVNQWYRTNKDYTQGFKVLKTGKVLESTGEYGKSRIQILDIDNCTGEVKRSVNTKKLKTKYFGEGTDLIKLNDGNRYVFQLTWQERAILVYSYPALTRLGKITIPSQISQGWGFSHDTKTGTIFITDGTSKVFTCKASKLGSKFSLNCDNGKVVMYNGQPQYSLNELEFKDGILYMNIYLHNNIMGLNINSWKIVKNYNMSYLRKIANNRMQQVYHKQLEGGEVLNGITWNPMKNCWMLTGKDWPVVFCLQWLQ